METITGTPFKIAQALKSLNQDKLYDLKEHRNRRSKTQNAYAWELIGQLADIMRLSKEEVYLEMLKDYGQSTIIPLRSDIPPQKWFKYYDLTGFSKNEQYGYYKVYRGSSEYDSREMAIFIDGIIQECENVGISTVTPAEIASWKLN